MEVAIEGRTVFCNKDSSDVRYFYWICKNIYRKKTCKHYEEIMQFYYDYVSNYADVIGVNFKDLVFSYDYPVIINYLKKYGLTDDEWRFIRLLEKINFMKAFKCNEYSLWKIIVSDLENKREEIITNYEDVF